MFHLDKIKTLSPQEIREYVKENANDESFILEIKEQKEVVVPFLLQNKTLPEEAILKISDTLSGCGFLVENFVEKSYLPGISFLDKVLEKGEPADQMFLKMIVSFPSMQISLQTLMRVINTGLKSSAEEIVKRKKEFHVPKVMLMLLKNGCGDPQIAEEALSHKIIFDEILSDINQGAGKKYATIVLSEFIKKYQHELNKAKNILELAERSFSQNSGPTNSHELQDFLSEYSQELAGTLVDLDLSNLSGNQLESSAAILVEFIKKIKSFYENLTVLDVGKTLELPLQGSDFQKIITLIDEKQKKDRYYSLYGKNRIEWSSEVEKIDEEFFSNVSVKFTILNAPPGSKFRRQWIEANPREASDEELIELIENKGGREFLLKALLSRSLDTIKKVSPDVFESKIPPVELKDSINHNVEKALYFLDVLSGKYSNALRKIIPPDMIPAEKNAKKRTFFFEAFHALKSGNVEAFRFFLSSGGYSADKFFQDTRQSSKIKSCESASLSYNLLKDLTKEELLEICRSPFSFNRYYRNEDSFSLNYSLSLEEAIILRSKINIIICFDACSDKKSFLLSEELSEYEINKIFEERKEVISSNEDLFSAYVFRAGEEEINTSAESVKALSEKLSGAEIRKIINVDVWNFSDFIDIKGKDGEYVLSEDEIVQRLTSKYRLEDIDVINSLARRNLELAKKIIKAYIKGNKALSEISGKTINIRRSKVDSFKALLNELNHSKEELVDRCFENGGSIDEFKKTITDWKNALESHSKGRAVKISEIDISQLDSISELSLVRFNIEMLTAGTRYSYCVPERVPSNKNIEIKKLKIYDEYNFNDEKINFILKIIKDFEIKEVEVSDSLSLASRIDLIMNNIKFEGAEESIFAAISAPIVKLEKLELKHFKFLEDRGLVFNSQIIKAILEENSGDPDIINWLAGRVGGLNNFIISEEMIRYNSDESKEVLTKTGIKILSDSEYLMAEIKERLTTSGQNFDPIAIDKFSTKEKIGLIRFIEKNIDPNYQKLNLISLNLETLDVLSPYSMMKAVCSLNDEDVINLFKVPSSMAKNKKIIKGIQDMISLNGGSVVHKMELLKKSFEVISPEMVLTIDDFIDISSNNEVTQGENFSKIPIFCLKAVEDSAEFIKTQGIILKNKTKSEIIGFLKSTAGRDYGYIRDTFQMLQSAANGLDAQNERINSISPEDAEEETFVQLRQSIDRTIEKLKKVASVDDIEHMHDRLVEVLAFIQSDPLQLLGQDKYKKLERSEKFYKEFNFRLFFPKTRYDLQYLGDENGWCVNYHKSYGDGVINKGNILVGICEKEQDSCKENVIALAHFLNQGNGMFQLEQLKWSSKKKNGARNVDATGHFAHEKIIDEIKKHIIEYEKSKKA